MKTSVIENARLESNILEANDDLNYLDDENEEDEETNSKASTIKSSKLLNRTEENEEPRESIDLDTKEPLLNTSLAIKNYLYLFKQDEESGDKSE